MMMKHPCKLMNRRHARLNVDSVHNCGDIKYTLSMIHAGQCHSKSNNRISAVVSPIFSMISSAP
jgi:hypothetical protein